MKTVYTFCMQKLYKMYTKCIQNVCMQNAYHILTNFCIHFVYKIKRTMPAKFFIQNVYKSLLKCGIYFHTYILYTFCIHQFWSTIFTILNPQLYNFYKTFTQNIYTNNCMLNGSLISTYFDPFVVHFLVNHCKQLRLETCWLIMGGNYQINGLLDYILH